MTPVALADARDALASLDAATQAELAAALVALDAWGLGGALVRAARPDISAAFVTRLAALSPEDSPMRRLPLGTPDDRLLGGLDLAMTLALGRPVAERGLLATLDGGVLIVPSAERVGAALAARLAQMIDTGQVPDRAPGSRGSASARVSLVLLDEGGDEDDPVHAALTDRVAFLLQLAAAPTPLVTRPEVDAARGLLADVSLTPEQLAAVVGAAATLGIASLRSARAAVRAARGLAALDARRSVSDEDLAVAVALALAPRATRMPAPEPTAPPPAEPPDGDRSSDAADSAPEDVVRALEDRLIDAARALLPVGLVFDSPTRASRAGAAGRSGADRRAPQRGRQVGTRRGDPRAGGRLDLVETLRAAAPWQPLRRRGAPPTRTGVQVRPDDFRIRALVEPTGTTAIFVVDASGSAAIARMAEAKGAVELLLADSYVRRDEVALIAFRGAGAEVLLQPTRAIAAAKRALAALPGGGGTPLAHAIDRAIALTLRVRRDGNDAVIVFLTDARANIARDGSPGRDRATSDALAAARVLRGLDGTVLFIDTASRPSPQAQELAAAMGARYVALPRVDARSIHAAVTAARR